MNETLARQMLDQALLGRIAFSGVIATITKEGVESYHVDFLRNECRFSRGHKVNCLPQRATVSVRMAE